MKNRFTYSVDYVLIDPDAQCPLRLMSRNRFNLWAVHDQHYGSLAQPHQGVDWALATIRDAGARPDQVRLLTQPAWMGYAFNPVSFWLAYRGPDLIAVLAEVNNTFGDRHSYLCHVPGFDPITSADRIHARKVMHVSPFQEVAGEYEFTFDIVPNRIAIRILHTNAPDGVVATLVGDVTPLSDRTILAASLRRPLGALRTSLLIYWQALKLKLKGAPYRTRPPAPQEETSLCSQSRDA